MRLERLNLEFFGHFSDKQFDFGSRKATGHDFHVIFGPNEAGKTTVMEAYLRLLYGFPSKDSYGFQHQRKNLRISGTLEVDGQHRDFTRLPTQKNALLDQNSNVVSESALQSHLGGLSMVDYRKLLCIDDESIELGGEEIVNSKGDIGALLFSAAAGIGDLSGVLNSIENQADQLYRRRATNSRLAVLKKKHADIEKQIRELDVPASGYRKLNQAYAQALAVEQTLGSERNALIRQQLTLRALIDARPLLMEIEELESRIKPFDAYPRDLAITSEEIEALLTKQSKASSDVERLENELASLQNEQKSEPYNADHLILVDGLEAIETLKSLAWVAGQNQDKQRRACDDLLADMLRAARDLNIDTEVDVSTLVLSSSTLQALEQARELVRTSGQNVSNEQLEVDALREAVDLMTAESARLESNLPIDDSLEELLTRFSVDTLTEEYSAARQFIKQAEAECRQALDEISSKGQRFEAIPRCAMNAEEVEELVNDIQALSQALDNTRQDQESLATERSTLNAKIAHIKLNDSLVDDKQAQVFKEERDTLWDAHKIALSADTAEAFETAMHGLDRVTEARLIQAKDLGELRQLEQVFAQKEGSWADLNKRLAKLEDAQEEKNLLLGRCASECGLQDALTPKSFLSWVRKLEVAQAKENALHRANLEYSDVLDKAKKLQEALAHHVTLETPELSAQVAAAKALVEERNHQMTTLTIARERLKDSQRTLNSRLKKLQALEEEHKRALERWQTLVQGTFSDQVPEAALQLSMQPLYELRELDKERGAIERKLQEMEHDQAQFSQQMTVLSERAGVEQASTPLETHERLRHLSIEASDAQKANEAQQGKLHELTQQLSAAEQEVRDVRASVLGMSELFPEAVAIETVSDLRRVVGDAIEADRNRAQKVSLELQVLRALEAEHIGEARSTLEEKSESELRAELMEVDTRLIACEEQ